MVLLLLVCALALEGTPISLSAYDVSYDVPFDVSPDGIVCMGIQDGVVVLLDRSGALMQRTGGRGQGPGEFEGIVDVRWSSAEQGFLVYDDMTYKLALFGPDGRFVREVRTQPEGDPHYPPVFLSTQQRLVVSEAPARLMSIAVAPTTPTPAKPLHTYAAVEQQATTKLGDGPTAMTVFYLWDPNVLLDAFGDHAVTAFNQNSSVTLVSLTGKPARIVTVPFKPQPVQAADTQRFLDTMPPDIRKKLGTWRAPEFWPRVNRLLCDDQHQVWIVGQRTEKGFPFVRVATEGPAKQEGFLTRLPKQIRAGSAYSLEAGSAGYQLHRDPLPQTP